MIHTVTPLKPEEVNLCTGNSIQAIVGGDFTSVLFFDIETTGLSPDTSFVFLIGCICFTDNKWSLHQFLIRFVQEERELLSAFFALAKNYQTLIHFNGNHFDIPFINKRSELIGMNSPLSTLHSQDLYLRYRPLKNMLKLTHMNQSTLEKWVGWSRTDELSGKEMIGKYWSYSVNNDKETEELILGHNRDDLLGMLHVPALEGYLSLMKADSPSEVKATEATDHASLTIDFTSVFPIPRPLGMTKQIFPESESPRDSAASSASYTLQMKESQGSIKVPIFKGRLRCYFPDYKNYYYLPLEHQVIHKSVAAYVEKEHREPATQKNCYVEQKGRFLPQPEKIFLPALQEEYGSKVFFFSYESAFCTKKEDLCTYAQILIKYLFQN